MDEQQRTLSETWDPTFFCQGGIPINQAWREGNLTEDSARQTPFSWLSPVHRIKYKFKFKKIVYKSLLLPEDRFQIASETGNIEEEKVRSACAGADGKVTNEDFPPFSELHRSLIGKHLKWKYNFTK